MAELLVRDVFRNAAAAVPDRVAAVHRGASITFGDLYQRGLALAATLADQGVRPGDRVVVWGDTTLDQLPVFVALAELGAVFAPVSGLLGVDEAAVPAASVRPALLLVDAAHEADGPALAARLDVPVLPIAGSATATAIATAEPAPPELSERDPHAIFFTSGSTGTSKGVVLSNRVSWLRSHPGALLEARGPFVCPYPMFHMAVWTQAMQQWHARGTIVFTTGDAAEICAAVTEHRAERINAIPAVWRRVLAHAASPEVDGEAHDLGTIRFADTGTSATPPDLLAAMRRLLPQATIRVFYGSTEIGAATMLDDADLARKPGSAGSVAPFAEIRLADDGELQVRGPQVFDGYHDDPTATAEVFTADGWYRTGDLAEIDDEGFVTIVGRTGDLIRTGGEAVVPGEVEAVVAEHPAVADVAVVGLPDPEWGQVVCAVVVVAEGATVPSVDELAVHCADRLARFKRPRRVEAVDELPRTASTGQVQRRAVAARLSART